MAVDKRIELEIALRDTASLALKAIADNLDAINKSLAKGGAEGKATGDGADTFRKIKEHTEGITKHTVEGAKTVTGLAEGMLPLTASLMRGLIGRGLLYEEIARFAANTITDSVRERLEWSSMSEDTGLQAGFIGMLERAQRKVGIEPPQAKANIMQLMDGLQVMAYGRGGPLAQELGRIGLAEHATRLEDLMRAGDREGAVREALEKGQEQFRIGKTEGGKYAAAFGLQPSFFKDMSDNLKTTAPVVLMSMETAKNWYLGHIYTLTYYKNQMSRIENWGVKAGNVTFDLFGAIWDYLKTTGATDPKTRIQDLQIPADQLDAFKERNKTTLGLLNQILGIFQSKQNKESIEKRESGGTVLAGRKYLVGEKGPELFRSSSGGTEMVGGPKIITPKTGGEIVPHTRAAFAAARDAAREAGVSDPETAASIAMLESGWLKRGTGSVFDKSGGTNPFGQTGTGSQGFVIGRDRQKHKVYGSLEEGFGDHFRRWGEHYRDTPEETVANLVKHDYNTVNKNWQKDVLGIRSRMNSELSGDTASLGAQIIFNNVPEGVETSAEGDGFDNFTVNKTRQLQNAGFAGLSGPR